MKKNQNNWKNPTPQNQTKAEILTTYTTISIFFVGNVTFMELTADYSYLKAHFPLYLFIQQFPPHWWRRPQMGHADSYREFRKFRISFSLQNTGMNFSFWTNSIEHLCIMQMQTSSSLKNWEAIQVNWPFLDVDTGLWKEYKSCTRKLDPGYVTCSICKLDLLHEDSRNCAFGSCTSFWSKQFSLY